MNKAIYLFPWDLQGEGVDHVLDHLVNLGMHEAVLALAYHAGKVILPHHPERRVWFPEDGVVYFTPEERRWKTHILRPMPSPLFARKPWLHKFFAGCRKRKIRPVAWIVCLHNSRLGFQHPEFTVENAFGDRYGYSLCPSQPEVARYLKNLVAELIAQHDFERVLLEAPSYLGFVHGYHHEFYGIDLSVKAQALLSFCFCPSCCRMAQKRGIDIHRLRIEARNRIDQELNVLPQPKNGHFESFDCTLQGLLEGNAEFNAFLRVRCKVVNGLLSDIHQLLAKQHVGMDIFGPVATPSLRLAVVEGLDLRHLGTVCDHYVLPVEAPSPGRIYRDIAYAKRFMLPAKIILSVRLGDAHLRSPSQLTKQIELAAGQRLYGCNFYNYSIIPERKLDWIKSRRFR